MDVRRRAADTGHADRDWLRKRQHVPPNQDRCGAKASLDRAAVERQQPAWYRLPLMALVKIYHCSRDSDRLSMAATCRHWLAAFSVPEVWRVRRVRVGWKGRIFARRFGRYVHHLELKYAVNNTASFLSIMEYLAPAQLKTLTVRSSVFQLSEAEIRGLVNFVLFQKQLVEIHVHANESSFSILYELLSAVPPNAPSTDDQHGVQQYRLMYLSLPACHYDSAKACLSVWFDQISDELLHFLTNSEMGRQLRLLHISLCKRSQNVSLTPAAWRQLLVTNPMLKVKVSILKLDMFYVQSALTKSMPVEGVDICDVTRRDVFSGILAYLTLSFPRIKELRVEDRINNITVDDILVPALGTLKGLKRLELFLNISMCGLQQLFILLISGRLQLEHVRIELWNLLVTNKRMVAWLLQQYQPHRYVKASNFCLIYYLKKTVQ